MLSALGWTTRTVLIATGDAPFFPTWQITSLEDPLRSRRLLDAGP